MLQDPRNTIGNLLQIGTIESVDLEEATCRVRVGDNLTGDIPFKTGRAGALISIWAPPSVGEQVELHCPEGDPEAGLSGASLYSDDNPAPSSDPIVMIKMKDGTVLTYDPEAKLLKIDLVGKLQIIAPDCVEITADVKITGDVEISGDTALEGKLDATGKITSEDDVLGGGKSLKGHKHLGVTAGGGVSGVPQ